MYLDDFFLFYLFAALKWQVLEDWGADKPELSNVKVLSGFIQNLKTNGNIVTMLLEHMPLRLKKTPENIIVNGVTGI